MRVPCVSGHKRTIAGIMGILLLFIVLFSAFYIIAESDHDCTGEDCPVCACITICENTLHLVCDGNIILFVIIVPVAFIFAVANLFVFIFKHETLVSKKVRLNN